MIFAKQGVNLAKFRLVNFKFLHPFFYATSNLRMQIREIVARCKFCLAVKISKTLFCSNTVFSRRLLKLKIKFGGGYLR